MKLFSGRIGRSEFTLGWIVFGILIPLLGYLLNNVHELLGKFIVFVLLCVMVVFYVSIIVKRLHDAGKSGWWSLIHFIPLANVALLVYLVFARGDTKKNKYGNVPSSLIF